MVPVAQAVTPTGLERLVSMVRQRLVRLDYSGPDWLKDNDYTTCNTHSLHPITITLDPPIPLSWVRVFYKDTDNLYRIWLSYQPSTGFGFRSCPKDAIGWVNNITVDMVCHTEEPVDAVTLSGEGLAELCSLYISGGRNVALKQRAEQSSHFMGSGMNLFLAQSAVDGLFFTQAQRGFANDSSTCSHTAKQPGIAGWWSVEFSMPVMITWFRLHNRAQCCLERLQGFTITAAPWSITDTPYSYTDPGGPPQNIYTVVPSPRISFPVTQVRLERAMSLKL
ncbi:hypothetical protein EGW08_002684 [Elysia chlorotica]|uniref:Uncharacterized protein n=1 Tax=Elysia chlorotica TaxID=188477 RepID=A0A3S1A3B2_ELYCH|nr:hypothetical protein EGW08_002684 [Elysia chlorotica]